MSSTFTLSGNESVPTAKINPPIYLNNDSNSQYALGLINFEAFYTIPNIQAPNNKFHFRYTAEEENAVGLFNGFYFDDASKSYVVEIPTGSYEMVDINNYLRKQLRVVADAADVRQARLKDPERVEAARKSAPFLRIRANNNTLRCEIKSSLEIDFTHPESIGPLLGFNKRKLKAYGNHLSDHPVDIMKINTICIDCSITTGSYHNEKLIHRIHQFFPTVPPGYKIVETPTNVIYLPINTEVIDEITLKILDQDGNLINFRGETITVRLHLKRLL